MRATNDPTKLQWAAGVIDRQVGHMARLVDDLLDISRINRGKIRLRCQPVEVAAVIHQAVEASRPEIEARRHDLNVDLPAHSLQVDGDPTRLSQVVTNLLNNAAKYTEPGGRIGLSVATEGGPPAQGEAVIRVRDSGVGIPPEMLASVFDLFAQVDRSLDRSEGGLGIGLTLVRRIVDLHGGSVQALSDGAGRGSEFVVRLPLARWPALGDELRPEKCGSDQDTQATRHSCSPSRRILVVDDNVDGADSLARLLKLDGHVVQVAHDGSAALAAANEFRPDVIVLDIGLPGMDGFEVARRLRSQPEGQGIVLVALTGYGREDDRLQSQEAGFDHHVVKPADLEELRQILSGASSACRIGAGSMDSSAGTARTVLSLFD